MKTNKSSLLKNTIIFTISNFSSKLLVFLMLPLYTSVLTTDEYGRADLVVAVTTFLLPVLTASVADATLRFGMDKKIDSKEVFTLSLSICSLGVVIMVLVAPVLSRILFFEVNIIYVLLIGFFSFYSGMFSMMARALDRVSVVGVAGVVSTFVTIISNIVLLVVFKIGLTGYLISMILTHLSSAVVLFLGCRMYKLVSLKAMVRPNRALLKEMLVYSVPLIPKNSCWWLIDTANKYILGLKDSTQSVGIYSAAVKIPAILTTVQGFFSQAWVLSAIDAIDSSDKEAYYSRYYAFYTTLLLCLSSTLILVCQILAHLLYAEDFLAAANLVPILIISTFFGGLIGFTSSIFSAIKKTKTILIATTTGAAISVSLDFLLIPILGAIGAAVSNAIAYVVIWMVGMIFLCQNIKLAVDWKRFCARITVLVMQSVIFFVIHQEMYFYSVQLICLIVIFVLSYTELKTIMGSVVAAVKKKLHR